MHQRHIHTQKGCPTVVAHYANSVSFKHSQAHNREFCQENWYWLDNAETCQTDLKHCPATWYRCTLIYYYYWSLLYSAILRSQADSLCSHVILHEWICFIARFWISTEVVYLQRWHGWCHMKLLPSRRVLCTPYNHAPCHFMQSHICKDYACV